MEFPGNSQTPNDTPALPDKKIEKVVSGAVIKKSKPLGRKFKDIFFGGDVRHVARYIAADVMLPAIRNMIVDTTTEGIRRTVYGESSRTSRPRTMSDYRPRVSYNTPANRIGRDPREAGYLPEQPPLSLRTQPHDVGQLILANREEAELVLERLRDVIDTYGIVSVADLYDLLGLPTTHVDNKFGWTSLVNVDIRQYRQGYILELPATEPVQ